MAGLKVTLLGGFEARMGSSAGLRLPTRKAEALLAYLGIRPGQNHSRDKLAALLWGGRRDEQARASLRRVLADLRKALAGVAPTCLTIEGRTVALNAVGVEVDVVTFEQLVVEGTPEALEHAAELYRGDLLLGFDVDEPLFEDWLIAERERLREMGLEVLAGLLAHHMKAARTERAIQTAVRLLALDPLQEAVHRTLMRLYARQGRRATALKQYQVCVGVLRRELGAEPESETKQLYGELLRQPSAQRSRPAPQEGPVRPAPEGTPHHPDLPAAETPLFGRQAELAQLRAALDDAVHGRGRVATVVGEAGIGKTRLVGALAADAVSLGCRVAIGRCHESDSIFPFGPWVEACRGGVISADDDIVGALPPALRAELTRLFPETGTADVPPASGSALPLFDSVAALVKQVAARQTLVLVLEDLHWADEMSLRLIAFLARRLTTWRVLLVVTARDDELDDASMARRTLADLSHAPHTLALMLASLSRPDTGLLIRALTRAGADAATVEQVEARVWTLGEGNPFVTVEAMRVLDRERASVAARPAEPFLPTSVRDLVARRLDRLSAPTQELAAVAAVIGRRFEFVLLSSAAAVDERTAAEAVEEMVRHHVLQAVGDRLEFTHDRVREVAHGRLLPPRRRLLHRAVAQAMEAIGDGTSNITKSPDDRLGERIGQLAQHALRGELWDRAVPYLRQAGTKAEARSAPLDARAWLEEALSALAKLPESPLLLREAFEIRLALRSVMSQLGENRRVMEILREAEALAERLDDDAGRGRVQAFMTNIYARLGDLGAAIASGERALQTAGRLGDLRLRILASTYLVPAHLYGGDYSRVVELATANLAALPPEWVGEFFGCSQPPAVSDRFRRLVALSHMGRFAEAGRDAAEIMELAGRTQHAYTVALAHHAASVLHLVTGDWASAHTMIEHQIAVLRAGHSTGELPMALAYSARALAYLGRARETLERIRECEQLLESQPASGTEADRPISFSLGSAALLVGRVDLARRLARHAVDGACGRVDFLPYALHLLGDVASHPDDFNAERGEACYRDALALAEARAMRPLVAHCHLGLGTLYTRLGKRQLATEHLATAVTMYRELDMPYWLEQAKAEIKEIT